MSTFAQTPPYRFPGSHTYSRAKIFFKNNNRIEVSNLQIRDDHLTFRERQTSRDGELDLSEVFLLKVSEGSRAGEYALLGGLVFGASAAIGIVVAQSNPDYNGPSAGPWIAGWTAGGALIGALAGTTQEKWKTIYASPDASIKRRVQSLFCFVPQPSSVKMQFRWSLN